MKKGLVVVIALCFYGCSNSGEITEVDPTRKFLLELRFSDSDVRKASKDFLDKLLKNFSELQTDKKPVVLFDRIDNKTDEHISGLDIIADRILTDLLDTGKFAVVDKRARDVIPEELRLQSETGAYLPESKVEPAKRIAPNYFLRGQIVSETQENKEMVVKSYFIRLNIVNIQTGLTEVQSNSEVKKVESK